MPAKLGDALCRQLISLADKRKLQIVTIPVILQAGFSYIARLQARSVKLISFCLLIL